MYSFFREIFAHFLYPFKIKCKFKNPGTKFTEFPDGNGWLTNKMDTSKILRNIPFFKI